MWSIPDFSITPMSLVNASGPEVKSCITFYGKSRSKRWEVPGDVNTERWPPTFRKGGRWGTSEKDNTGGPFSMGTRGGANLRTTPLAPHLPTHHPAAPRPPPPSPGHDLRVRQPGAITWMFVSRTRQVSTGHVRVMKVLWVHQVQTLRVQVNELRSKKGHRLIFPSKSKIP